MNFVYVKGNQTAYKKILEWGLSKVWKLTRKYSKTTQKKEQFKRKGEVKHRKRLRVFWKRLFRHLVNTANVRPLISFDF